MHLRFWGTRGSIATPGPSTNIFGGNTSCVEVVTNAGARFILDCGTGARPLGLHLMAHASKPLSATILLSHTHWDHIQGFPFFLPLFVPGSEITVCAPQGASLSLQRVLAGQMEYTYFPVELGQLGAHIEYRDLTEGVYEIGEARIRTQFLNHPAIALGYRIEADGASIVYLCDHEPFWECVWDSSSEPGTREAILHDRDRLHADFMRDADAVIHDAQYTPEEYPAKKNWGHSTYSYVVQLAGVAKVKKLFLTHHDPLHSDDFLQELEQKAQAMAGSSFLVQCAREGYAESFENLVRHATTAAAPDHSDVLHAASLRILVVDDDEDLLLLARKVLQRAGHSVMQAESGPECLRLLATDKPDLIILDLNMPGMDGFAVLRELRARDDAKAVPVIVLTARGDEESARNSFEDGATDFLAKPFTAPQLDARVRSCFAHASAGVTAAASRHESRVTISKEELA